MFCVCVLVCVCVCAWTHNLQFDGLAIQFNGTDFKVHSDGADVALCVGVILRKGRMIKCDLFSDQTL